jgi:hypothetical protein
MPFLTPENLRRLAVWKYLESHVLADHPCIRRAAVA